MRYPLADSITVVTAPTIEPLTLSEAKLHLRIDDDDDDQDSLVNSLILTARRQIEHDTRRALMTQTHRLTLDRFPCGTERWGADLYGMIEIPRPPLREISQIDYVDGAGVTQTLTYDDYQVDNRSEPGRLAPAYGLYWPETRRQLNAVSILYLAGWTVTTMPDTVKHLMRLWIGHFYENREPIVTGTIIAEVPFAMKSLTSALNWGDYR